ncbi:MAG: recombinase family protein [Thiohalocapsa sp.]
MHVQTRPPLFWGYTRFSTPPQQWGDSDRRQDAEAREQATKLGLVYVDSYRDLGISAYHSKNRTNGALGRFLDDLRSPSRDDPWPMPGDILWFENFDRMSRAKPRSSLKLFMEIVESGVILMVRDQKFTPEILDEDDWRWQQVLSELVRAHKESKWKSERLLKTYEGNRERARQHTRAMVGNRCPAWLQPIRDPQPSQWPLYEFAPAEEPKEGEPQKPRRAEMYRQAWEMADGGVGSPTIADHFNTTGVPVLAHRIHGKPTQGWTAQLVRQLLRNPAAMGVYRQKKLVNGRRVQADDCEDVEGYYPALVDPALFYRVDAALKGRAGRAGKGPHGEHYANLFKGLCVCGHNHDHAVTIGYRSKEGLRYLRCDQSRHKNCDNKTSFQYERFERLMLELSSVAMSDLWARLLPTPTADPRRRRIAELEAMIPSREEQIEAAWKRWLDPAANSTDSMTARAEQQIERMDREVAAYKAELADLRQELNVIAAYGDKTFHERIRAARRQLWTAEGEDRKAIRLRLAQEFRRRIERIMFNHDGTASVLIHEHGWHIKGEFLVSSERVERLTVWSRDIADQDWPNNPMRPILVVSGNQLESEDFRDCLGLFATHAA